MQVAVNHWIGTNRLNAQEVSRLFENRRVIYVYQRIQMIQHACVTAGIQVPFDHVLKRLDHLNFKTAIKCFENSAYFEERLKKENAYEKYELNKKIIDFEYIPQNLVDEFMKTIVSV